MSTDRKTFSQATLDEYMAMHDRIVAMKYSYLTVTQLDSIGSSSKQDIKDEICELADAIRAHFAGLLSKEINDFNITDFERREHDFLKETKRSVDNLVKKMSRLSPVKIEYRKAPHLEQDIDAKLLESRVYDSPALERHRMEGLGRFQRYLLDHVYVDDAKSETKPRADVVEKELLQMKVSVYEDRFREADSGNLDILYKMKTKFESLFAAGTRIAVVGPQSIDQLGDSIPEQITLVYDELYNVRMVYRVDTTDLDLSIILASSISTDGITYSGEIRGVTTAAGNSAHAHLRDPRGTSDGLDLEAYRTAYQEFLQQAELRLIYSASLANINLKHRHDEENEIRVQNEMRDRVSSALDDLL